MQRIRKEKQHKTCLATIGVRRRGSEEGAWQLQSRDRKSRASAAHRAVFGSVEVVDLDMRFA